MSCCSEAEALRVPARRARGPHVLDPEGLSRHIDTLYRAAWALCGSQHDAEDLVQETLVNVLKRPRLLRDGNELGYLLRALRNTFSTRYRLQAQRPVVHRLCEHDAVAMPDQEHSAREIIEAIASAPPLYRDAVIAVDLMGLSYREASRALRTHEASVRGQLQGSPRQRQRQGKEQCVFKCWEQHGY